MGLDRDEIDLYLDAEVQKIDQQTDAAARKQKGKTCPYCGGSVPQFTDKCPHCGENITAQASEELRFKSDEAKIESLFEEVSELVDDGNLDKANNKLVNTTFLKSISEQGTYYIVKYYDPIYLKVIKAYINQGNYEAAEELVLSYRGKIGNELSWKDAPTYIYLRSLYKKEGRDFSALKSDYDYSR